MPGAVAVSWRISAQDLLLTAAVGSVAALMGTAAAALLKRRVPVPFLSVLVMSVLMLLTMGAGPSPVGWLVVCLIVLLTAPLLGSWIGTLIGAASGHGRRPGRRHSAAAAVALLVAAAGAGWLTWPGPGAPEQAAARAGQAPPDPTAAGAHPVTVTAYGTAAPGASDRYGSAETATAPLDASAIIEGWDADDVRSEVWGFDASALPVNATVWAPADERKYPLLLLAHGNSPHEDSELGFDYLGELLATRGYIVASIDQSFLNTSVLDRAGGIHGADLARARLILAHLDQWAAWTQDGTAPVEATADLSRVALIGHSRGGEAAAVAAALRQADVESELPGADSAAGIDITSVVALAPSDGIIPVDGEPATLEGVNYLTIGGSHDADVGAFAGTKQYARTGIAPGQVKAAVSIYRANHSQFNTRWGSYDAGLGLSKHLLDTEALLGARDQQQAAAVFVSAFLDATLSYDRAAMRLFETPAPDVEWLPRTDYRIAVASGDQTGVIGFADVDHSAGDVNTPGPTAGEGTAQMTALPLRTGVSDNTVLHVRPDRPGGEAAVTVDVSDSPPVPEGRVVVDLADARPHEIPGESATVEVDITDSAGRTTTCPLTGPAGLPGQMPATTVKLEALTNDATSEPTLQTHTASTDCIANGAVGLDAVEALTFRARGLSNEGLYLDNAGVAGGH